MTFPFQRYELDGVNCNQEANWKNNDDYAYIDSIAYNIENAERKIKPSGKHRSAIDIAYDSYIYEHYIRERTNMARLIKSGEYNESSLSPHFVWRHSHMQIAWEYLRRSLNYRDDFERYENAVSKFLDVFIELAKSYARANDCTSNFVNGMENYGIPGRNYVSWYFFSTSEEVKRNPVILYFLNHQEIRSTLSSISEMSRQICAKWGIHEWFCPTSPTQKNQPIIVDPQAPAVNASSIEIVSIFKNGKWVHHRDILNKTPSSNSVIVSFSLERDLETQMRDAHYRLERLSRQHGMIFPKIENHKYRENIKKHKDYFRIIDARNSNVTSAGEIASYVYPNDGLRAGADRVSKAAAVCDDLLTHRYIHIATMPFRK